MKILVCVKWASDPVTVSQVSSTAGLIGPNGSSRFQISRYDEYALEEALRVKERDAGVRVDAITVGPPEATDALVRAMALGADHGIAILAPDPELLEAFAVASRIAAYASSKGYDLIFAGVMSEDLMQGQVGPMVAELLSASCATAVIKLAITSDNKSVRVERELERGLSESFELQLPAVLTIQTGSTYRRYPKLSNQVRAKKYPFERVESAAFGPLPTRQEMLGVSPPQRLRSGRLLEGTVQGKARELVSILRKRALLT